MFVGHYGVSFVIKKADASIPLWVLFIAVQWLDVLWAPFVLLGIEKVRIVPAVTASNPLDLYYMPYTHSLLAAILWSAAATAVYRLLVRASGRTSLLVGLGSPIALGSGSNRPSPRPAALRQYCEGWLGPVGLPRLGILPRSDLAPRSVGTVPESTAERSNSDNHVRSRNARRAGLRVLRPPTRLFKSCGFDGAGCVRYLRAHHLAPCGPTCHRESGITIRWQRS